MNILVTGCNGQLGNEFQKIANSDFEYIWHFTDIDTLDICNEYAVNDFFNKTNIDICINCAAYTAVDNAEDEPEKAHKINAIAPSILAKICKTHKTLLIHISTDYVFDGNNEKPYIETDPISPDSVYGRTKADGEVLINQSGCSYFIIRTSWLYSSTGRNFVKTMLRLGSEKSTISVVNDQKGNPTWAFDLASAIMLIIKRNGTNEVHEIFHFSNEGIISWFDFANTIFEISEKKCRAIPISSNEFPSKVKRPAFSALDKSKIKKFTGSKIPFWKDSLIKCLEEIERKYN